MAPDVYQSPSLVAEIPLIACLRCAQSTKSRPPLAYLGQGQRLSYPLCWNGGMQENKPAKPDHHLWNNNGTFWCHYTVHEAGHTKRRVRVSLHTKVPEDARARRDALLKTVPNASLRFMPGLRFAFSVGDYPETSAHALSVYDAGFSSLEKTNP